MYHCLLPCLPVFNTPCGDECGVAFIECVMKLRDPGEQLMDKTPCLRAERSDSQREAMARAQREALHSTPEDCALVARGNAKLAAASLLRALAKQLPRGLMSRLSVCAMQCSDDSGALALLRSGWYYNRCYFFE